MVHRIEVVLIFLVEYGRGRTGRRWGWSTRTRAGASTHAHLLLSNLYFALTESQFSLSQCQFGGAAVWAIVHPIAILVRRTTVGIIAVYHKVAELFKTLE